MLSMNVTKEDTQMATGKKNDERKAKGRYMDQPGQWVDKTSAAAKRKRSKAFAALEKSMKTKKR